MTPWNSVTTSTAGAGATGSASWAAGMAVAIVSVLLGIDVCWPGICC